MRFEPVRIIARLGTPVAGDPTLPLDALLWSISLGTAFDTHANVPGHAPDYDPAMTPLRIVNDGPEWFYACSFAQWGPYCEGMDHWNKRLDEEFAALTAVDRVDTGAGRAKAYHSAIAYRHALHIVWFASGDRTLIERMLRAPKAAFIGKKGAQGWGRVLRWQVDAWPEDWSLFGRDGLPMRPIPFDWYRAQKQFRLDTPIGRRAYRPPYYASRNVGTVVYPL